MCYFITGILAGTFDLDEINRIAEPYRIVLKITENRSLAQFLEPGDVYFMKSNGCDCGTDLCQYDNDVQKIKDSLHQIEYEEAKRRKKGWSNTKVARWKEQKTREIERFQGNISQLEPGSSCYAWSRFGNELFEKTGVTRFGLLLHFYTQGEHIDLKERLVLPRQKLTPETLFRMKEDALNVFTKR